MRVLLYITIFSFSFVKVQANDEKNEFTKVEKTPFLMDFFKRDGFIYAALGPANTFIHPEEPVYADKPQILLKNGKTVSITLSASGRIYECIGEDDSSYHFKRKDHSPNQNYNIGGYYFYYNGDLYCYSGYGFWKSHGTLKIFNKHDCEWDLIPLKEEIIPQLFPIGSTWFDSKDQRLFVPFQSVVNAGIMGEENLYGTIEPTSMVLDLKKNRWEKTGTAAENTVDLIKNAQYSLNTENGLLFINNQELYLMDYRHNCISKSINASFNQSLLRSYQRGFLYQYGDYIYYFNQVNASTDSIGFRKSDFVVLPGPIWNKQGNPLLRIGALLSIGIFLVFLIITERNKKDKITPSFFQKQRKMTIEFSDMEKSLLKLLWEKTQNGTAAAVSEINYTLGTKDKNTGLQKKVRSDIFNSINEKYSFLVESKDPLILTIRSEADKRFFEFCLSGDAIDHIKEYLL